MALVGTWRRRGFSRDARRVYAPVVLEIWAGGFA
jgi:hypothetical protein